jgi:predicted Zn-dependent protease
MGGATSDTVLLATLLGGSLGGAAGKAIAGATNPRQISNIEWNRFEEDEADQIAFDWLLESSMDVNQIPNVYYALRDAGDRDHRMTVGFLGRSDRVRERLKAIQNRIEAEKTQPGWASRRWQSADSDFDLLLAEVKRDNGVFAFHYDMLETARDNLKKAVAIKTQDPTALYFYAKVVAQTARTDAERTEADEYFRRASEVDYRNQNYGSHLHRAVILLTKPDANAADKKQAVDFLKRYLLGYHFSKVDTASAGKGYPPHLESVYDYMARAGEFRWSLDEEAIKKAAKALADGVVLVNYLDADVPLPEPTPVIDPPAPKPEQKKADQKKKQEQKKQNRTL